MQRGIRLRVVTDSGQVTVVSKTCVMYSIPEISDVLVAYATMEGKNKRIFSMGDCFTVTVILPNFSRSFMSSTLACSVPLNR